jgi:uncharacterized protein
MQSNKTTKLPLYLAGLVCAHAPVLAQTSQPAKAVIQNIALAAAPAVTVPDSHVHYFKSAINGNDYQLFVFLPGDYYKTKTKYPVLYLLDGNAWQAAYAAIQRITLGGDMPHIILVGVGYQGASMRSTDYPTPAKSYWDVPADRGAPVFLRVLKDEVLPRIEQTYRIDSTNRGLGGHSMGGYFTLYTLFHSPETFQRYWISSPSIVWDDYVILKHEEAYAQTHKNLKARVFADMGELEETDVNDAQLKIQATVESRHYPDLHWSTQTVPDLPHISVPNVAVVYAMYDLYGREVVSVPADRMQAWAGNYRLSDGTQFQLTTDGKSLFLENFLSKAMDVEPALKRLRLLAHSPDSFFARYIGITIDATSSEHGRPQVLKVSKTLAEDQETSKATPPLSAVRVE